MLSTWQPEGRVMTHEIPSGSLEWIADDSPSPDEEAEALEEFERRWLRAPKHARPYLEPGAMIFVGGLVWLRNPAEVAQYDTRGKCPGCGDRRLPAGRHCLVCSADAKDPRQHPQRDMAKEEQSRAHDARLAGGTGPVKRRAKRAG